MADLQRDHHVVLHGGALGTALVFPVFAADGIVAHQDRRAVKGIQPVAEINAVIGQRMMDLVPGDAEGPQGIGHRVSAGE